MTSYLPYAHSLADCQICTKTQLLEVEGLWSPIQGRCTKVGKHFYQGEILLWRKWLSLKASKGSVSMLFSHGYSVDCGNRWLRLYRNPLSGSLRPCPSLKPHGSAFIARQMCPPKVAPLSHLQVSTWDGGQNSPGPRGLNEPSVKCCRNKRARRRLDRREIRMLDGIPLTWFHLPLEIKRKKTNVRCQHCKRGTVGAVKNEE